MRIYKKNVQACLYRAVLLENGEVELLTPYWHLWYLLSFCMWTGFCWIYFRFGNGKGKITILILSILVALLAGYVAWIDRTFSLSFILHAYGQLKSKEIAAHFGKNEGWARITYYRAKQQIVQEVSKS